MLETQKVKLLFFVSSPKQDLKAVSGFLSKRNFKVQTETDVRDALMKIIELQPDFVFLAWDHTDKKIVNLPVLIQQASAAAVVPFITTNTNEAIIKFSSNCPLSPKLFPPMSGPAVERLVQKTSRDDIDQAAKQEKIRSQLKTKEDLKILQQKMIADLDRETSRELEESFPVKAGTIESEAPLPPAQHTPPPPPQALKPQSPGVVIQKGFRHSFDFGAILQRNSATVSPGVTPARVPLRAYCISIFNNSWCGYFIVATKLQLGFSEIKELFSEWIRSQVGFDDELKEEDFFEFDDIDQSRLSVMQDYSEYTEKIDVHGFEVTISFFKVEPENMLVERNAENGYIKIKTSDIPIGQKLEFSLMIHLPENKKYLLYTLADSPLEPDQKERLLKNKIENLYTTPEHEPAFRRFLAHRVLTGKLSKFGGSTNS